MILRRPYAFLIKYFKIIHIILFIMFGYLLFSLRKIYLFLVDYVKKGTFNYIENMVGEYIPIILIVILIFSIISGIFIYLLMKRKDKPSLFYMLLTIYSSISFILIFVYRAFFNNLEITVYETLSVIIYRDIMAFLYYICYFFIAILFVRAFGFDIKKFSFEKDRKELNLDTTDNEEVELGLSLDKYDTLKKIRKNKREFIYYYKENETFFRIIGIALISFLLFFMYIHFFVNNKVYNTDSTIELGNIEFKVLDHFITKEDEYQNVISPDNYFLVMNLQINNKNDSVYTFDNEIFRIYDNINYYHPSSTHCSSFSDLGTCYTPNTKINKGLQEFILIFKINNSSFNGYFEILKNKKNNYNYLRIDLKSSLVNLKESSYEMNNDYFNIESYKYADEISYEITECQEENCVNKTKNLYPNLGEKLLILKVNNMENFNKEFLDNYLGMYYYVNDVRYKVSSSKINVLDVNNNDVYISVPNLVLKEQNIGIYFQTRRNIIYIKLGDENV